MKLKKGRSRVAVVASAEPDGFAELSMHSTRQQLFDIASSTSRVHMRYHAQSLLLAKSPGTYVENIKNQMSMLGVKSCKSAPMTRALPTALTLVRLRAALIWMANVKALRSPWALVADDDYAVLWDSMCD